MLIKNNVIELLTIKFEEGNKVKIIDGPLVGLEGQIVKYNFHKRVAYVNISFGNVTTLLQLGIDVIEKEIKKTQQNNWLKAVSTWLMMLVYYILLGGQLFYEVKENDFICQ